MSKEIYIELDNYFDLEHGEYGATLVIEYAIVNDADVFHNTAGMLVHKYFKYAEIIDFSLFTYDKDGGESRQLNADDICLFDYISDDEIQEEIFK